MKTEHKQKKKKMNEREKKQQKEKRKTLNCSNMQCKDRNVSSFWQFRLHIEQIQWQNCKTNKTKNFAKEQTMFHFP